MKKMQSCFLITNLNYAISESDVVNILLLYQSINIAKQNEESWFDSRSIFLLVSVW